MYYPEFEEAGLYFRRDDEGNVVTSPGKIRSIAANVQGNSGVPFMDLRRKQIIRADIPCLEECAATALLRRADGSVSGVFALDYISGEFIVVLARAVILATGYSDRLHARSTGTREMSGDGIAMAWRAGAASPISKCSGGIRTTSPIPRPGSACRSIPIPCSARKTPRAWSTRKARNSSISSGTIRLAYGPYTVQLKALAKEVHAGTRALRRRLFRRL